MNKINFKKSIFFFIIFLGFFFLFQIYIDTANMAGDDDYFKEIEKIKALPLLEGYEAYMKLKRDQTFSNSGSDNATNSSGSSSGTGNTSSNNNYESIGKTYNTGKIEHESWFDEEGNEHEGNQKISFQYYGTDANCTGLDINEEKICRSKHPFWNPGTFKMAGNLAIEGVKLAFNAVDSSGINWIMTGIFEPIYNALGFDKNNNSLIFGYNVYIEKNLIMNNDNSNSVFLRGENSKEKIVQTNNDISIHNNGVETLKVIDDNTEYKINLKAGLEVEDYLKTEKIIFKNNLLLYCNPNLPTNEQNCADSNRAHNDNFIYK